MKVWILRWLGIAPQQQIDLIEKLRLAQHEHISDLRVLLDKSSEREAQLAAMVERAFEQKFPAQRVQSAATENRTTSPIPPEHLTDVATFDSEEDDAQIRKEAREYLDAQNELHKIFTEQAEQGIHKPELISK